MTADKQFRVWRAPMSGRYFAAWTVPEANGRWRWATGKRHDVTDDIERIIAEHQIESGASLEVATRDMHSGAEVPTGQGATSDASDSRREVRP